MSMRGLRFSSAAVSLAFACVAFAGLSPGPVVVMERFLTSPPGIADMDGDGLSDLVLDRTVLLNRGGGSFLEQDLGLEGVGPYNGGDQAGAFLDVNADGRVDLLTNDRPTAPPGADRGAMTYRLYIAGQQLPYGNGIELGKNLWPWIADADGDGRDDIVLKKSIFQNDLEVASELTVLVSRGDGTFAARQPFRIPRYPHLTPMSRVPAGDLNHDGITDLVIKTSDSLLVLRGIGGGDFAPAEVRYIPQRYFGGWITKVADVDGDGHLDVIVVGLRIVRVFLGDGTGRFPRSTSATIAELRTVPGLSPSNSPGELVLGQFVRHGRTEIAANTTEGDVVILAYERGQLREVARFQTEYVRVGIAAGQFREPGKNDLWVNGAFLPNGQRPPAPRLFYVDAALPVAAAYTGAAGRSRAVRGMASPTLNLDVQMSGTCAPEASTNWSLQREGVFGLDARSEQRVETVMDDGAIVFRMTVPWSSLPVEGRLEPKGSRRYEGKGWITTQCGARNIDFTAIER